LSLTHQNDKKNTKKLIWNNFFQILTKKYIETHSQIPLE
jgi:hypothetical protein